ncbi:MAG: DUF2958 domain-containing protein [Oligoflexia bacterium]|nr:DUF2958 domain-containing protein [Oligoflexia bacterium]
MTRELIPPEIAQSIPMLYQTENTKDPIVHAKLFHPCSNWTWFVLEYDPVDRLCFGLTCGFESELGYFAVEELEDVVVNGLGVERDLYFTPKPLSQVRAQLSRS